MNQGFDVFMFFFWLFQVFVFIVGLVAVVPKLSFSERKKC
ncbi:hypothetical protein pEaSNUABM35_00054 [Erwinia phage pEa_SNUABM_35]|uniref:Uncharacterized protein n=1 Tax=Erwinia phage pEa_SNUABM_35 TaxID=2869557 RepID=A0AAE7XQY8_9CAUD|nr:hypothetical protein MPK65_gp054 [Erwinia phage pEa_SNUABM_35]QZE59971.1 hypothetical protein pEaSNUABM35_00054 [Erwinia phage pEa_SNUABM_35]QZE60307.1 hypothetical protein pEaSNUABM36_00054 [Erwinia phage pEa_SNUABM_36]